MKYFKKKQSNRKVDLEIIQSNLAYFVKKEEKNLVNLNQFLKRLMMKKQMIVFINSVNKFLFMIINLKRYLFLVKKMINSLINKSLTKN